jgi:hypothetical protein
MRARAIAAAGLLSLVAVLAAAQGSAPIHEARVPLRTGFVPDPAELEGHTRGARAISDMAGPACAGFVDEHASHVLSFETRFGFLRVFATSETDLVLAVRRADGSWLCNDDRFGTNPNVEGVFPAGRIEVWVGTHVLGASADYVLTLSEMRSVRPGVGASGVHDDEDMAAELGLDAVAATGRFAPIHLHRGFLPDPRWIEGAAGRTDEQRADDAGAGGENDLIEVSPLGDECRGLAEAAPSHVVTLQDDFDFLQLYLCDPSDPTHCLPTGAPLSLVVRAPDGSFRCHTSDDAVTAVTVGRDDGGWPAGDYRVWVAVHHPDVHQAYRLGLSELRRVAE